jgi:hypothetical protein
MLVRSRLLACAFPAAVFGAVSLAPTIAAADCSFTPPLTTETKCLKAMLLPNSETAMRSFDISWDNPKRAEFYFADRSNKGVQVFDTDSLLWKRKLGGFVGIVLNGNGTVNNNVSGPDGVTSHGRWLYAGDGDSTLKVFDLNSPSSTAVNVIKTFPTATTRLDEMALTSNGKLLIAANNAEDPPFATLFQANGNGAKDKTKILAHITVDPAIMPTGIGLSIEQPAYDPKTKRFFTSLPIIANNPAGCNADGSKGAITCNGGVLVTDPDAIEDSFKGTIVNVVQGAFDPATRTGVIAIQHVCGPNGASVGPDDNIIYGCNPANNPANVITLVMNAMSHAETPVVNITGADEVWFNKGDDRYYTGSSRDCKVPGTPCPAASQQAAVLGVIDAKTNTLIEKIPQSSGSHSVAADYKSNLIFVPQVAPVATVGSGGDTTSVGAGICGGTNGCVAVYQHKVKSKNDHDDDEDDEHEDHQD